MRWGLLTLEKALQQVWPALSLILILGTTAVLVSSFAGPLMARTVTEAFIYVTVVIGLYIFIGNTGIMSFGSISFMAIGAYATAWQTCCPMLKPLNMIGLPEFLRETTVPLVPAALLASTLPIVFALIVGLPIVRLSGISASIATLAVLAIVYTLYANWDTVTLGTSSTVGIPIYVDIWVALGCAVATIAVAYAYQVSRFGIAVRAARQDEVAAKAAGINVPLQRLLAWVLGAFFVGLGGILYAHFLGVININNFYLEMTLFTLAMLVIGGFKSLSGAVLGVLIVSTLDEALRQLENGVALGAFTCVMPSGTQQVVLGLLMLLILILRPSGVTGGKEIRWPGRLI